MNEIPRMGGKLHDIEKASIVMELLARLIRPDEKKINIPRQSRGYFICGQSPLFLA